MRVRKWGFPSCPMKKSLKSLESQKVLVKVSSTDGNPFPKSINALDFTSLQRPKALDFGLVTKTQDLISPPPPPPRKVTKVSQRYSRQTVRGRTWGRPPC